jgi:predicted ATP-grasp superfamily ATP-dependent carboligase
VAALLRHAAERLGSAFQLRGLFSVDALVEQDRLSILEVNPRPGASIDAFELAHRESLFALHAGACRGGTAGMLAPAARAAASEIVYAPRALEVPAAMAWPAWTADPGPPGTANPRGGPVCTVLATGADIEKAMARLRLRTRQILTMMIAESPAGAPRAGAFVRSRREDP